MEFKNSKDALVYARINDKKVSRDYRIKTNDKTGQQRRIYFYKIVNRD